MRLTFLRHAIEAFPYNIHTILTDNGIAFADLPKNRNGASPPTWSGGHIFGRTCAENGITPQADEALSSLDQRPSRADEPHNQRRDDQGVPLSRSR